VVDETESGLLRQAEDLLRTETPDPARLSALAESLSAAGTCPDGRIDFLPPLARVGKRLLAAGEPRPASACARWRRAGPIACSPSRGRRPRRPSSSPAC